MDIAFPVGSIKRLIYLLFVACIAIASYYHFSVNSQSHWIIWLAFGLSFIVAGKSFSSRLTLICMTGLITTVTVFIVGYLTANTILLVASLFIITAISIFIANRYPALFFIAFIINLFTVVAGMYDVSMTENINRSAFVFIGMLIAIFPEVIFWPHYKRNELRTCVELVLRGLKRITNEGFSCFLQTEYSDNLYLYERRWHVQKNKFLQSILLLQETIKVLDMGFSEDKKNILKEIEVQLETVYEVMINCMLLRIRVTDYTIFSVCKNELAAVAFELNQIYSGMIRLINGRKHQINLIGLADKIKRLEENYQTILQITAKEPFVFLLFISSLKALNEKLVVLYESMLKLKVILEQ